MKLLKVREISEKLGVHRNTIYSWVQAGLIPFIKVNGRLRFDPREIDSWLRSQAYSPEEILEKEKKLDGCDKILQKRRIKKMQKEKIGSIREIKAKKGISLLIDFQLFGTRVRETLKVKRRSEAQLILNERIRDLIESNYSLPKEKKRLSFSEMADLYFDKYSKPNKKSWRTSDQVYLKPLKSFFDGRLEEITPEMIETYRGERLRSVQKCSVNREVSCLRKIFNVAVSWGYALKNPVKGIKFFNEKENQRRRFLSPEEEARLIKASPPFLQEIVYTALNTGLRKAELFNLKWEDVDFGGGVIRIPENKEGREKEIPMNSHLENIFRGLQSRNGETPFVFFNPQTKKPYSDLKKSFGAACKKAGIKGLRFHDLRHTFGSRLASKGVSLVVVKELLGHASIKTTERYLHCLAEEKREAVEALLNRHNFTSERQENVIYFGKGVSRRSVNPLFSIN